MLDPAGRSMAMSTEPSRAPEVVVFTDSRPSTNSTLVRSATRTWDRFAGSTGRTDTTVSVRSPAVTRTRAPATCTVTAMGVGVAKVCMSGPLVERRAGPQVPDGGDREAPADGGHHV